LKLHFLSGCFQNNSPTRLCPKETVTDFSPIPAMQRFRPVKVNTPGTFSGEIICMTNAFLGAFLSPLQTFDNPYRKSMIWIVEHRLGTWLR
jgi:hypothetical protein